MSGSSQLVLCFKDVNLNAPEDHFLQPIAFVQCGDAQAGNVLESCQPDAEEPPEEGWCGCSKESDEELRARIRARLAGRTYQEERGSPGRMGPRGIFEEWKTGYEEWIESLEVELIHDFEMRLEERIRSRSESEMKVE